MAEFEESRPCLQCDGTMDRRHGTLPRPPAPSDVGRILPAHPLEIGTYYRCLKNGAHTVIVERDAAVTRRRAN